jgi:CHAD domain-containing protein
LVIGNRLHLTTTYLDTFDWRLWRAGFVLVEEQNGGRRLVLLDHDRAPHVVNVGKRPRLADDLPAGHFGHTLGPIMGIRALVPLGVARVSRREGRLENPDGEMLAPVRIEDVEPLDREDRASAQPFMTLEIRGRPQAALPGLTDGLAAATGHDLEAAVAARGRLPGDYGSRLRFSLEPGQPAEEALRTILLELLTTLEANVEGTIEDLDTEFLHDLRVACRRTRSALTQLGGVLATEAVASFNIEFKWLGAVTGPLRDLDVFLLALPAYRTGLPDDLRSDLEPLEKLIVSERTRAHTSLVYALRSRRFVELLSGWREFLEAANSKPSHAGSEPVSDLAARRISKAVKRILKRGAGLGLDPPATALHRLRIDAKKLRYLLEFFGSLYPPPKIKGRVKALKKLQDILGGVNDMQVQRERLTDYASRLHTDPRIDTSCILTLGRLAGTLEARQKELRLAFHGAFTRFSSPPVTAAFKDLVGNKEPK